MSVRRDCGRACLLVLVVALTVFASPASGPLSCSSDKMVRVEFRGGFSGAGSTTVYRLGTKYGRLEERVVRGGSIQSSYVVNEPHVWRHDFVSKRYESLRDSPGEAFHAYVVWRPGLPESLQNLEFGCEAKFLEEFAHEKGAVVLAGKSLMRYDWDIGDFTVSMLVEGTGTPHSVALLKQGQLVSHMRYFGYHSGLEPDMSLFAPIDGVQYVDILRVE